MSMRHQDCAETESLEIGTSSLDVASKFRIYRTDAESTDRKLKEANAVIERLKEEINSSRGSEKNLRNQLSSAQDRLLYLQQALTKLIAVSEQQRQNEKISKKIEQKIEKISEEIKHTREESQNLLEHVSREMDLLKEVENLRSTLAMKIREQDLMKMEIQTLKTENKNMVIANQQKLRNLENEMEKLKQRNVDAEASYGETLMYYQRQLEERDQTIKLYEKERKGFLDDFAPLKVSEIGSDNIHYEEGAVSVNSSKRAPQPASSEGHTPQMNQEESNANMLRCSQSDGRSNNVTCRKGEDQAFPKMSRKQKPQLEFLVASQRSSQSTTSVKSGQKRRLFSASSNCYID